MTERNVTSDFSADQGIGAQDRKHIRQIRQSTRARLMEIRKARLERPGMAAPTPQAREEKHARRAARLAQLTERAQDARMAAGLASGAIELWDAVDLPDLPEVFGPVWQAMSATEAEHFGPPWNPDRVLQGEELPLGAMFGPFLPEAQAGSESAKVAHPPDLAAPLTESVALPEPVFDFSVLTLPELRRSGGDLGMLPGIGPALIWMLEKCGICTLADLAEADLATLVTRLGLVGQIVDVPGWQRFARRRTGGRRTGGSAMAG